MTFERRTFLKLSGLAGAGVASAAGTGSTAAFAETAPGILTAGEMRLLKLVMARMLPGDATGGGAVEAGAHVYIERALGGYHARHLGAYRLALAAMDRALTAGTGPAEQRIDTLIGSMEKGEAGDDFAGGGTAFFGLLRGHLLEGTFGDPSYGGNRDYVGWQMIGFPGVQLVVSAAEQAVDGPRANVNRSVETFGGKTRS